MYVCMYVLYICVLCSGNWAQDFVHIRQALYHWITTSTIKKVKQFFFVLCVLRWSHVRGPRLAQSSPCSSWWPGTHYIVQAVLSSKWFLQACISIPNFSLWLFQTVSCHEVQVGFQFGIKLGLASNSQYSGVPSWVLYYLHAPSNLVMKSPFMKAYQQV